MFKNARGFTIVELLIVIVVIAILAAISVVAFSGIQQRSRATARIAAVQNYMKLFHSYASQYGSYPSFTNGVCLGTGYTNGVCTNSSLSSTIPSSATEQAAFNTALSNAGIITNYPKLSSNASTGGNEVGAFVYNYGQTNETPVRTYRLVYFLEGSNQDCGLSRVIRNTDGSAAGTGAFTVSPNLGYKNSLYTSSYTMCMISLLNPNEF